MKILSQEELEEARKHIAEDHNPQRGVGGRPWCDFFSCAFGERLLATLDAEKEKVRHLRELLALAQKDSELLKSENAYEREKVRELRRGLEDKGTCKESYLEAQLTELLEAVEPLRIFGREANFKYKSDDIIASVPCEGRKAIAVLRCDDFVNLATKAEKIRKEMEE